MQRVVFVLGHRGMLGSMVHRTLASAGSRVLTSDERYTGAPDDPLIRDVVRSEADSVVNCLGITTARKATDQSLLIANALLPMELAARLDGRTLIHASTDCVFDGRRGGYGLADHPNALDPYGLSKRLGEACVVEPNVVVLRTSLVGPEAVTTRGLLAWFLSQTGPVDGWVDHRWNGITTLAWAELCIEILSGARPLGPGLHQPTTTTAVSKYELLQMFADAFGHRIEIRQVRNDNPRDMTLVPTVPMPELVVQLRELRASVREHVVASSPPRG